VDAVIVGEVEDFVAWQDGSAASGAQIARDSLSVRKVKITF
jgi:hypothetical protein